MTKIFLLAVLILSASINPSLAAEQVVGRPKAMERFRRGEKRFNLSDYAAALEEFRAAYLIVGDPLLLFNIAQCHRMLGNTRDAITFYNRYRKAQPEAPNRGFVDRRIAELEAQLQSEGGATSDPGKGAIVPVPPVVPPPSVNPAPVVPAPLPVQPSVVNPPVAPGPTVVEHSNPPALDSGRGLRIVGLVGAGVGLVAVGIGVPLHLSAAKKYDACVPNGCPSNELPRTKDTASVILIWGGATLAVAGVATYLLSPSAPIAVGPVSISSLSIDPRGVAILAGRY